MDITVSCQLTPDEVTRAYVTGLGPQLRIVKIGLPVALVGAAAVFFARGNVIAGAIVAVAAVVVPLVFFGVFRRSLTRQLEHLSQPSTVRVTDDGYEQRAETYATEIRWSMFDRVATRAEFWQFYAGKRYLAFLPRRIFDEAQQAEFDAFLAARLKASPA